MGWICENCSMYNEIESESCIVCDSPRPPEAIKEEKARKREMRREKFFAVHYKKVIASYLSVIILCLVGFTVCMAIIAFGKGFFEDTGSYFRLFFEKSWQKISSFFSFNLFAGIGDAFVQIWERIVLFFKRMGDSLSGNLFLAAAVQHGASNLSVAVGVLSVYFGKIRMLLGLIVEYFRIVFSAFWQNVKSIF